jgi:multidrug efflux pump subunit AcrA (membrane-fusion protein)
MTDTETDKVEQAADAADKLSDKSKEPDRELSRIKRALRAQQAEKAEAQAQLEALRKEVEDSKLSAQERERKELENIRKQADEVQRQLAQREAEMDRLRLINKLVGKHKLLDEDYADIVLKRYNPKEHDDFDAFVAEVSKEPKFKVLFAQPEAAVQPTAPSVPGSGTNRTPNAKAGVSEGIEAEARELFPNDVHRQETYIRTLKQIKGLS